MIRWKWIGLGMGRAVKKRPGSRRCQAKQQGEYKMNTIFLKKRGAAMQTSLFDFLTCVRPARITPKSSANAHALNQRVDARVIQQLVLGLVVAVYFFSTSVAVAQNTKKFVLLAGEGMDWMGIQSALQFDTPHERWDYRDCDGIIAQGCLTGKESAWKQLEFVPTFDSVGDYMTVLSPFYNGGFNPVIHPQNLPTFSTYRKQNPAHIEEGSRERIVSAFYKKETAALEDQIEMNKNTLVFFHSVVDYAFENAKNDLRPFAIDAEVLNDFMEERLRYSAEIQSTLVQQVSFQGAIPESILKRVIRIINATGYLRLTQQNWFYLHRRAFKELQSGKASQAIVVFDCLYSNFRTTYHFDPGEYEARYLMGTFETGIKDYEGNSIAMKPRLMFHDAEGKDVFTLPSKCGTSHTFDKDWFDRHEAGLTEMGYLK